MQQSNLRVLSVWGADKHHAEMNQRDERRQDRRLLAPVDGSGAREDPGGLVLEFAFEPEMKQFVDTTGGLWLALRTRHSSRAAGDLPARH